MTSQLRMPCALGLRFCVSFDNIFMKLGFQGSLEASVLVTSLTKHQTKNNLRKKGLMSKTWQQEHDTYGHVASIVRKKKAGYLGSAQFLLQFSLIAQTRMVATTPL